MNARLYDPVLHTFLSPDANITDPSNPQNYNRYAYALNNPLLYVDYSGNDPITLAMVVTAAIIGGTIAGVTYVAITPLCEVSLLCEVSRLRTRSNRQ